MPAMSDAEERRLIDAYRDDRPTKEICRRFAISKATMYAVLDKHGVKYRAAGRGRKPAVCEECTPEMIESGRTALRKYRHLETDAALARIWAAMQSAAI